jgi:hypothetical protein
MPTFVLTHHFPRGFQGSPETAAAATAWFDRIGTSLVGRGNPSIEPLRLGNCPSPQERMVAYTVLATDDPKAAVELAQAWPLLARGGGIEVRELTTARLPAPVAA